jgi:hypothetical protein
MLLELDRTPAAFRASLALQLAREDFPRDQIERVEPGTKIGPDKVSR